jgi:hypothetical protein
MVWEATTGTPHWNWARLLARVFDLAMATCPFSRHGALCIIAAITQESVSTRYNKPASLCYNTCAAFEKHSTSA